MGSSPAPQSPQHPAGLNMPGKEAIPIGCSAIKPVERHGWEAVSWFLYDKNTGAIRGRTPLSWLLITIFYIIYYAFLAGFWALMLIIFFQFIEEGRPRWDYSQGSLIGSSPALGLRPNQDWDHIDSSMLIFNKNKMKDGRTIPGYAQWVGRTDNSSILSAVHGQPISNTTGVTEWVLLILSSWFMTIALLKKLMVSLQLSKVQSLNKTVL